MTKDELGKLVSTLGYEVAHLRTENERLKRVNARMATACRTALPAVEARCQALGELCDEWDAAELGALRDALAADAEGGEA